MNSYKVVSCALLTMILAMILWEASLAHPSDGLTANEPRAYLGGFPSSLSWGTFQFIDASNKPPLNSLSKTERYMLAGATGNGKDLAAWYLSVFLAANRYYVQFGSIPDVLTDSEIRRITEMEEASDQQLDELRNPITGQWPKLKATSPSPGDLYMQPLTIDEMHHFADLVPQWQKEWFEGRTFDTQRLLDTQDPDSSYTQQCTLFGAPFYIRLYGTNGVLLTTITHVVQF